MKRRILVPVDGSDGSTKAYRFALTLAAEKVTEIILIHVQPNYQTSYVKRFFSPEEIAEYQQEMGRNVFEHILKIARDTAVPVRTLLRIGDPATEICKEAQAISVDFIVIGYRGLGGVQRAILGSVATQVLHETRYPLMIVP